MPWPVYLALKHLFPTGRRVSFFTAMSVLGVTLGVTVLLAVQSVMNGFAKEYEVNLIRAQGNIIVRSGGLIEKPEEIVKLLQTVPGVTYAEPFAMGVVMLQFENRPAFMATKSILWPPQYPRAADEHVAAGTDTAYPSVRGFDVNHPGGLRPPLADMLVAGKFEDLDDHSILLGWGLAQDLGAHVGDTIDVTTPLMLDRLKNNVVLEPRSLTIAGIFQTGWTVADNNTVGVTLRTMQDLYGLGRDVGAIEVRLDNAHGDISATAEVALAINQKLEALNHQRAQDSQALPLRARTWYEINSDLMDILLVEKNVMFYIMIFIVVVAAFSIASSLVTSVVRKTREIGMLGALGASPRDVATVFCLQGFIIGVAGTILGVALAGLLLHYRQPIIELFVERRLLLEFYKFLSFPVEYRSGDFIKIIVFTLIITTLAGLLPAWRAARIKPAVCLRNE